MQDGLAPLGSVRVHAEVGALLGIKPRTLGMLDSTLLKWKLKGSLESQLYWMLFCWGRQVKEHFTEAGPGEGYSAKACM